MSTKPEVPPKYISRKNAAKYLDCSVQFIDKKISQGRLTRHRLDGRKVVLLRSELESLVEVGA